MYCFVPVRSSPCCPCLVIRSRGCGGNSKPWGVSTMSDAPELGVGTQVRPRRRLRQKMKPVQRKRNDDAIQSRNRRFIHILRSKRDCVLEMRATQFQRNRGSRPRSAALGVWPIHEDSKQATPFIRAVLNFRRRLSPIASGRTSPSAGPCLAWLCVSVFVYSLQTVSYPLGERRNTRSYVGQLLPVKLNAVPEGLGQKGEQGPDGSESGQFAPYPFVVACQIQHDLSPT